jgi:DNA repair protein RadC
MTRDLFSDDLGQPAANAVATHNAAHAPAPALSVENLGVEVAAINILREHGADGLAMLSSSQREAVVRRMLEPVTGVSEVGAPYVRKRTQITGWAGLLAYAREAMAGATREQFRVFFLDKRNQLIADEIMSEGTVDHAPVYPREVARRALELDASAIILAHNHPSGDPTPSAADVQITDKVLLACRALGISTHDHIVVGRDGIASMRALGLMS